MNGHAILTTSMSGRCIKRAGRKAGPFFLKYVFLLEENTGMKVRMTRDRSTGARLPFGVSSDLSYHR